MIGMHTYVEHPCNQMQQWRIKAQHERLLELCTLYAYQEDSSTVSISKMKKKIGVMFWMGLLSMMKWLMLQNGEITSNHVLLVFELIIILFIEAT
jgi:hypothetical protein